MLLSKESRRNEKDEINIKSSWKVEKLEKGEWKCLNTLNVCLRWGRNFGIPGNTNVFKVVLLKTRFFVFRILMTLLESNLSIIKVFARTSNVRHNNYVDLHYVHRYTHHIQCRYIRRYGKIINLIFLFIASIVCFHVGKPHDKYCVPSS